MASSSLMDINMIPIFYHIVLEHLAPFNNIWGIILPYIAVHVTMSPIIYDTKSIEKITQSSATLLILGQSVVQCAMNLDILLYEIETKIYWF